MAKLAVATSTRVKALLEKILGNDAFIGRFGDERPGGAGSVFREQERDRFRIGRPARAGEKAFYVGELLGEAGFLFGGSLVGRRTLRYRSARYWSNEELQLAGFWRVGEEGELLAVG